MFASVLVVHLALAASPSSLSAADAMQQGLQHYRDADFEGAIPLFQRAAADDDKKTKAAAQVWLGLSFLNIGNADLAKQSFRAALLADSNTKLPDEAPPAATPMFANIKGDLERTAPKAPTDVKPDRKPEPEKHPDVPEATAQNEKEHEKPIAPDLSESQSDSEVSSGFHMPELPRWVPQATAGAGAALLLGGGYFKLASNSSFNDAANASTAAQASELSHHADKQQHVARTLAITGVVAMAAGVGLYLLNE